MYYRRKILLSLLEQFDRELSKLDFQKLLFIFSHKQVIPYYEFVPYKFGCYSFQSNADFSALCKYGIVEDKGNSWRIIGPENYYRSLKTKDQETLTSLKNEYARFATDDLIKYTYRKYPYYAIKSLVAVKKLNNIELKKIEMARPTSSEIGLYTIGYEGISIEAYLNKLIKNDVKVLCDVRNSPRSMKFGFSKSQLYKFCNGLDILYLHLPQLGIVSNKRKQLVTKDDYEKLFKDYNSTTLQQNQKDQLEIIKLIKNHQRVAITCFEADYHYCHRLHLSERLKIEYNIKVYHI